MRILTYESLKLKGGEDVSEFQQGRFILARLYTGESGAPALTLMPDGECCQIVAIQVGDKGEFLASRVVFTGEEYSYPKFNETMEKQMGASAAASDVHLGLIRQAIESGG